MTWKEAKEAWRKQPRPTRDELVYLILLSGPVVWALLSWRRWM